MTALRGGARRLGLLLGMVALTMPATASAAGEAGPTAKLGTEILGVAAEPAGTVVAVGKTGSAIFMQRLGNDTSAGTAFSPGPGVARSVAVQADGKIVIAGTDFTAGVIKRFNADGSTDAGFGSGGTISLPTVTLNAVAVGPGGTVVAGGSTPGNDGFSRVALVRVASNGQLDGGFGAGGVATLDLGRNSQARAVAVQGDGKVVFAGQQIPDLQVGNALIGRSNADGSLDGGFDGDGAFIRSAQNGGANAIFEAVAIDSSGRIVGAGAELQQDGSHAVFARLAPGGTGDGGFGSGGIITTPASVNYGGGEPVGPRAVALAGGGEIVATGIWADSGLRSTALWAITPGGQLDTAVGNGTGRVLAQQGSALAQGNALAVTFDGNLFVGGTSSDDLFVGTNGFVTRYNGFGPIGSAPPPPPPPPPPPVVPAAKITAATLSPRTIRPKTKARLRFTLSRGVRVTLTVERKLKGRRKGKQSCRKPSRSNRGGKSCTYYSRVKGTRTISGKTGANTVTITRRFANRNLSAGSYRLVLRLSNGNVRRITFTVRSR